MPTAEDFDFFKSELPKMLSDHKGQFVVIKDQTIYGYYPSIEEAVRDAYGKLGNQDFLIQEITDEKYVNYINAAFVG